jgi:hypothetical protein
MIFCIFADPYTFNTYKLLLVPSLDNVVDDDDDDDDDDDLSTSEDFIT